MEYICPVLGEGDERDFIAIGQAENFKIAVFTNLDMYHEGCKYLGVTGYEPIKVSDELFKDLAKKDDEFAGIIVNIHNEKKIINKEELERLEREKYVVERKLTAAKHKEKRLQSELKRLTRSERTHRLCTRAGMLETFLKEPTTLTDDDVMELLTFIFHSEAVQKKLDLLIANRKELGQPNGS